MPTTANQATSTLATAIKTTDASMSLQSGDHVHFPPNAPFFATLGNPGSLHETVLVTAINGDTCAIVRGQMQTQALAWGSSTPVAYASEAAAGDPFGIGAMLARNPTSTNTAQALASNGTIAVGTLGVSKISTSGAVTGIIMAVGSSDGQTVEVINTSANSITMAAKATSNVADGTSCVIAASTARRFIWEATGAVWYREG